ncbi:MAG: diphthamide biosynthesis enzyme Dph2 [Candidatus Micrarchaeia archaeon]
MRIMLQFPEGLKQRALEYVRRYVKEGHEVVVSSEPSYGACDIPVNEALKLGCAKIVHFGHVEFCKIREIEVEYVPYYSDAPVDGVVRDAANLIKAAGCRRVGVITNLSHVRQVPAVKELLVKEGLEVFTAKGSAKCPNECQILGCDVTALTSLPEVDCVLYVGGGTFHALAPGAMHVGGLKPVLWADPFSGTVKWITEEIKRIQKQRKVALMRASEAKVYGILVSTKPGQYAYPLARTLQEKIRARGKDAVIIVGNTFDFTSLNNFMWVDAWINTACPRIADDQNKLRAPIINASEAEFLFK